MPIDSTHPDYNKALCRWELTRSVVNNDAEKWIRVVDREDEIRSKQYRRDAILTNFTRLTKIGLTGLVFRKPPKMALPDALSYLEDDATGYNFNLNQVAQFVIGEVLETGRMGILVDYPKVTGSSARFKTYTAESIRNWAYKEVGSQYRLALLVLQECVDVLSEDGYEWVEKIQYRVLRLSEDNVYYQTVMDDEGNDLNQSIIPLDYNGNTLDIIPFTFIGSENNDAKMDSIPLYDLAVVNLGHYKNSADYEESIFVTGQPFIVINLGDANADEFKAANPDGIRFGSRAGLIVGNGGSAQLLQANANQLAATAMEAKKADAAAIGARLISPPGGRETAEAARIRFGSQNSALYTLTKNISLGFELALYWASLFMMETPTPSVYVLNDQFYEEDADPNLIAQEIMLIGAGCMSVEEVRLNLSKSGIQLIEDTVLPEPVQQTVVSNNNITNNPEGNINGSND